MRGAGGGPRILLRRLREIMAEPVSAQARLDRVVVLIAANMVSEVCSLYVMRADSTLELYATEGLNREAVHHTTMRAGEGLVGLIAQTADPLALSDAQTHPGFSFKPETGEEIYHGFLGVPVLRGGNTLGVLVVQNRTRRVYAEEEVEALQTTAMVLAELIASGELQALGQPGTETVARKHVSCRGVALAEGLGLGHVVLHEPRVVVRDIIASDVDTELERLDAALRDVRGAIDALLDRGDLAATGEHRDVLETFRMFAHDQGWLRRMRDAVATGLTAEAAVERVQNDTRAKLLRSTDPYLRERLHDLDDLGEPPAPPPGRARNGGQARRPARQRGSGRPNDGPGRAPRLRPLAPARAHSRGRRADQPHCDRRPRPQPAGRLQRRQRVVAGRDG
jgi:phosphotransferase system enzyme I (PtsP)